MRLIKLDGELGPIYINPDHVVAIRKALKHTMVETVCGKHTVHGEPDVVARALATEDVTIDITPRLRRSA